MTSPAATVLDASAFLAYLQGEPGAETVATALLEGAHISAVNWAEVLTKLADRGRAPAEVTEDLENLGILGSGLRVEPATEDTARTIAELRNATRRAGLSFGDRACLALASELGLPALTTDRAWKELALDVEVRAIREGRAPLRPRSRASAPSFPDPGPSACLLWESSPASAGASRDSRPIGRVAAESAAASRAISRDTSPSVRTTGSCVRHTATSGYLFAPKVRDTRLSGRDTREIFRDTSPCCEPGLRSAMLVAASPPVPTRVPADRRSPWKAPFRSSRS